jgi:hypothetical protein
MVAKVRERLGVSKQAAQKFNGERFNLRELIELKVRKQYHEIKNRFPVSDNLRDGESINRTWENIRAIQNLI